ncbi:MAG: cupin domain-containing protein [Acetobacteraceae bacterium]|nr:cupin domain-containing protein [Acetobacteraceae bacterium]
MRQLLLAALIVAAAVGQRAAAEEAGRMVLVPNDAAVKWQPAPANLPKGSQLAVLAGDPAKPGPFALRVKFPPNTLVAPHRHATDENLTVISGELYHGMGETVDKAHGHKLEQGGFVYLPGGSPHSVWTAGSESVVQVTGTGPFGLSYVNPEDDPSKQR